MQQMIATFSDAALALPEEEKVKLLETLGAQRAVIHEDGEWALLEASGPVTSGEGVSLANLDTPPVAEQLSETAVMTRFARDLAAEHDLDEDIGAMPWGEFFDGGKLFLYGPPRGGKSTLGAVLAGKPHEGIDPSAGPELLPEGICATAGVFAQVKFVTALAWQAKLRGMRVVLVLSLGYALAQLPALASRYAAVTPDLILLTHLDRHASKVEEATSLLGNLPFLKGVKVVTLDSRDAAAVQLGVA